MTEMSQRKKNR